jgi:predicted nucleotide-binding protein
MARPPSALPALTLPRDEAARRLKERIDLAKGIAPSPIQSDDDLARAQERENKWRSYNVTLLTRIFTTDDYAAEYASSQVKVHQPGDALPISSPGLNTFAFRLNRSLRQQVTVLESVIERLDLLGEAPAIQAKDGQSRDLTKIFVVHGHDEGARESVARFLGQLGIKPIILHEQASRSRTVIEKVEANSEVGFTIVLLTPDDEGCEKGGTPRPRARQNVMLELGYFIGLLGRENVCALERGGVEIPSDFAGVIAEEFDAGGGWRQKLAAELRAAGFEVDLNKVLPS